MNTLPLLPPAPPDAVLALHEGREISRALFLQHVAEVAAALPAGHNVLNLCRDRYLFTVGLCASICRGVLSLLPNTTTEDSLQRLRAQAPDLFCLIDHADDDPGLPAVRLDGTLPAAAGTVAVPLIPAEQPIACLFTSGSTGQPQPHVKTWARYVRSGQTEAALMWPVAGGACAVVGTVPYQHSYGLESTVMMPLMGGGVLSPSRPFFPADIAAALAAVPRPRLLVTTPFHLRALLDAQIEVPPIDLVLSATAPLDMDLAARAEGQLGVPLMEIYGSTETGQIASRRTTREAEWRVFDGVTLRQESGRVFAAGGHVEEETALNDVVELVDPTHFRLLGRHADMINVAGKRSSLAFLNHVLTTLPGVRDGAFCLPHDDEAARLAAFVVAPGLAAADIQRGLRSRIDAAFLPRPLVFLDRLPRNATGKLPQEALQALIDEHILRR